MAGPVRRGSIVWVVIPDPTGRNPKLRPAVVVTPTAELQPGAEAVVVAVSTQAPPQPSDDVVELPWHPAGHLETGLRRRSVAKCVWNFVVQFDDLPEPEGAVPPVPLAQIIANTPALRPPPPGSPD